jgi:hypothetical protein
MTKEKRENHLAQLSAKGNKLLDNQRAAFQKFVSALHHYSIKDGLPNLDDFYQISTKGILYFNALNNMCNAIIANQVDAFTVPKSLMPKIKEDVERTLPVFYKTLQGIAQRCGTSYHGELKREDYEGLYSVYEKYCLTLDEDRGIAHGILSRKSGKKQ